MRARFEGGAHVSFDERRRTATIDGSGQDTRSRSTGAGRIELAVLPATTGGSILRLRLRYALKGPLAQFGRGAVVDTVVEQILERFASNLASTAGGGEVGSAPTVGVLALATAAWPLPAFGRRGARRRIALNLGDSDEVRGRQPGRESPCVAIVDQWGGDASLSVDSSLRDYQLGVQIRYLDRRSFVGRRAGLTRFQLEISGRFLLTPDVLGGIR